MRSTSLLVCLSWLSGSLALPAPSTSPTAPSSDPCDKIEKDGFVPKYDTYLCGSDLLGPRDLPVEEPLKTILAGYSRFGNQSADAFLQKYTKKSTSTKRKRDWIYPGDRQGFKLGTDGLGIQFNVTLKKGTFVDRFGDTTGKFMSLACTPYTQRAIPPVNLAEESWSTSDHPFNYHVYRLVKDFNFTTGPSAPGFEQIGLGLQFWTRDISVGNLTIGDRIMNDTVIGDRVLEEVKPKDLIHFEGCFEKKEAGQAGYGMGEL